MIDRNMKSRAGRAAAAALALLPLLSWGLAVKPQGSLRVEGDSTLHKWASTATVVDADFVLADEKAPLADAVAAGKVKSMTLTIPASGMRSGEKGLDKNMMKAMKAEEFPAVAYTLRSFELGKAEGGVVPAKTKGELTIAGKTKEIAMDLELRPADGRCGVRGSHTLNMSEYGITPPKLMMGAIKVRDSVTVRFDLTLNTNQEKPQ